MEEKTCSRCSNQVTEDDDPFCSKECTNEHIESLLSDLIVLQAKGPPREKDNNSFNPPSWVAKRRWFYFIDQRAPDIACFGTFDDVKRCINAGGWPFFVEDTVARKMKRTDAREHW